MTEFERWNNEFKADNLYAFNDNINGLLWLKVRAVSRKSLIRQFADANSIDLKPGKLADENIELYNILLNRADAMTLLDNFLCDRNREWYNQTGVDIDRLKTDLYHIHDYAWGGDQSNSLDRYFVDHYVKSNSIYDHLESHRDDIGQKAWNYVRNSWYNNWTSFLIESLFKNNPRVVSAVGEIKCVDFFIDDIPLDLKVTYFPVNYMNKMLKESLGKGVLAWLKSKAKPLGISVDSKLPADEQEYIITEKLSEQGHDEILTELADARKKIVEDAQRDPIPLITNLYEQQGAMRFGAENRLFLILIDTANYDRSWKLKRAVDLIEPEINCYLDRFTPSSLKKIVFQYKNRRYKSLSDAIFIIKN